MRRPLQQCILHTVLPPTVQNPAAQLLTNLADLPQTGLLSSIRFCRFPFPNRAVADFQSVLRTGLFVAFCATLETIGRSPRTHLRHASPDFWIPTTPPHHHHHARVVGNETTRSCLPPHTFNH